MRLVVRANGTRSAGARRVSERAAATAGDADRRFATREEAIAWASRLALDPRTVYLDTETTGLDARAEVVDIAVVASDGRVLLETLVRPVTPIPLEASRIHGIFDADVADAPSWQEVHDRVCAAVVDRIVVVYNAAFDRRMVSQCCGRHGLLPPDTVWECAMRGYAAFHGERTERHGFRLQKLERAVATFGAAPGGHRAAADALACRAVVLGMAAASAFTGPAAGPNHPAP